MPSGNVIPSPREIIMDILVAMETGWGDDEEVRNEMEANVFIQSMVAQILGAMYFFGWLRELPKKA